MCVNIHPARGRVLYNKVAQRLDECPQPNGIETTHGHFLRKGVMKQGWKERKRGEEVRHTHTGGTSPGTAEVFLGSSVGRFAG